MPRKKLEQKRMEDLLGDARVGYTRPKPEDIINSWLRNYNEPNHEGVKSFLQQIGVETLLDALYLATGRPENWPAIRPNIGR